MESTSLNGAGVTTHTAADRLFLEHFAEMSTFGATEDGGVDRQALSAADVAQRRWLEGVLQAQGFRVEYDEVGNQFGLLELTPGAPYVLTGSHMDSQPTAGRFDGAYGVLASAHAAFRVAAEWGHETPPRNLAVVNWFNEEGSRFTPSMMGSAVFVGLTAADTALGTRDRAGISVAEALEAGGFSPTLGALEVASYAEIHVEQGRILEDAGVPIGLVTATWAADKYRVVVRGSQAHSGATLMADRRDALFGAALLVVAAREIADAFPGTVHTAVGQLDVYPNSPVVVASEVALLLDIRAKDEGSVAAAVQLLNDRIAGIEETARVAVELTRTHAWGIDPFQPEGVELARAVADRRGLPATEILTVAGHDSVNMKGRVPTVMLFVPSVSGVSHNTQEYTRDEDLIAGLQVLTDVVGELVRGSLG